MIDLFFVVDGRMNRLKSLFVHKMRNPRDRAPILEVLEAAGVHVCEKIRVSGPEDTASTTFASEVIEIDAMTTASTLEFQPSLLSTITAANASTSTDGQDRSLRSTASAHMTGPLRSELPTPTITDEGEWMVHRSEHLMRIKQKREERRRGGVE